METLATRRKRVLVVDDSDEVRELWTTWLTIWGFHVVTARNGAEAVQKALADPPDVVLMDLAMPVMDGITATARLKDDSRTSAVPVVVTSAESAVLSRQRAAAAGAAGFIDKPCQPDLLLSQIREVLRR